MERGLQGGIAVVSRRERLLAVSCLVEHMRQVFAP